jgi:hypothetical protein
VRACSDRPCDRSHQHGASSVVQTQ